MSHFYGTLQGLRGGVTRCGTKTSDLVTVAASWHGAVSVRLWYDKATGRDRFNVYQIPWHGNGDSHCVASGFVGEAIDRTGQPITMEG